MYVCCYICLLQVVIPLSPVVELRKCNFENKICMTGSDIKACVPIFVHHILEFELLSCQPRVTVTSCFVYKVIRDLESVDHLCINPIRRIGLIQKCSINSR